jgi:hypothetical protein
MKLDWSFPGAVKYSVTASGPTSSVLNLPLTQLTSYELKDLKIKTKYTISVIAIKADGTSSANSFTATTTAIVPYGASITASNITNTSVYITWESINADFYDVRVTPGNFKMLNTKERSAVVNFLNAGTKYSISVFSYGAGNTGPTPKVISIKTTNFGPSIPKLLVSNVTADSMNLEWKSERAVKYDVKIDDLVSMTGTKERSYALKGLERKTKYNISITAFDSDGVTSVLNEGVATLADFVECPSISFKNVTSSGFTAVWKSPSAVKYDVTITPGDFSLMGTTLNEADFSGDPGVYTVNVKAYGQVKAFITASAVQKLT